MEPAASKRARPECAERRAAAVAVVPVVRVAGLVRRGLVLARLRAGRSGLARLSRRPDVDRGDARQVAERLLPDSDPAQTVVLVPLQNGGDLGPVGPRIREEDLLGGARPVNPD